MTVNDFTPYGAGCLFIGGGFIMAGSVVSKRGSSRPVKLKCNMCGGLVPRSELDKKKNVLSARFRSLFRSTLKKSGVDAV